MQATSRQMAPSPIIEKQQRESDDPLPDPYVSAEDVLKQMAEKVSNDGPSRR